MIKLAFLSPFTTSILNDYIPEIKGKNLPQGMGGSAVFDLVKGLIETNLDVHIITLQSGITNTIELHYRNIHYYMVPRRSKGLLRDLYRRERKYIVDLLKDIEPDVVHANWTYEYALAALNYNKDITLITAHDIPLKVLKYSSYYYLILFLLSYYIYLNSKWIVFVSKSILKYAKPFLRNSTSFEIIPNIFQVDDNLLNLNLNSNLSLPKKYFVSIGLWNKLKNIKYSIKAFNEFVCTNPDYYYVLIGPGLNKNGDCENFLKKYKLSKNIILLGKLDRLETLKILKKAKALIHPSYTEACPMVVGEAMKLGTPVIVGKNSDGATELVESGKFGHLVDLCDYHDLIEKLNLIINRSDTNIIKIEEAKKYIEHFCNKEIIVDSYLKIYKRVIDECN